MAKLRLNGAPRPGTIQRGTLGIEWSEDGGGIASFTMLLVDGGPKPQDGDTAELFTDDWGTKLWAGKVEVVPERQVGRGRALSSPTS